MDRYILCKKAAFIYIYIYSSNSSAAQFSEKNGQLDYLLYVLINQEMWIHV